MRGMADLKTNTLFYGDMPPQVSPFAQASHSATAQVPPSQTIRKATAPKTTHLRRIVARV
jgi:hypothetical protein